MPGISVSRIPIPFNGGGGFNAAAYWATLISATVENAAPTHVVLTFPTAQTSLGASDFTIAGFTVSSASWTGAVLTLVVHRPVTFLDLSLTITFVKTGTTATVTNNVAGTNLLAYYDHVQGADPTKLYDLSGNAKHGTLYVTAPPSFTTLGTVSTGTEKIDLPALSTDVAPHTIIVGYKQTNKTDTMGQLLVANTAGNFMNYFFITAPGLKRFFMGANYTTYLNYVQSPITDWEIISFVIDHPVITVYRNGIRVSQSASAYNIKINSAELSRIGFKGINGVTAFYNKALSDAEQLSAYRSLAAKLRARGVTNTNDAYNSVICDGDSMTYGSYASDWYHSYPNQLRTINPSISVLNLGVGGQRIDTMLTNAPTVVDPLYMSTGVSKSIVICWGGSNDLAVFGRSDTDVYNDIASYCSGRQTTGFKVIVLTILPRTDCTAGEETYRQSVNTSIRANWATFADALVDVAADTRLDDFNDATYFYTDKIHLTDAGYAVVASLINTAILALP